MSREIESNFVDYKLKRNTKLGFIKTQIKHIKILNPM